jgi:hypothetical protein
MRIFVACWMVVACAACSSLQATAAKDPMKCERDPKCAKHDRAFDCSSQCADDSACVDRCREVQATTGSSAPR